MKVMHYSEAALNPVDAEGAEHVGIRWLISKDTDKADHFAMRLLELGRGGATPLHTHAWEHQVFVLSGRGVVWREGEEVPIQAGTVVHVLPEEKHCFKNTGDEDLRFLCLIPV